MQLSEGHMGRPVQAERPSEVDAQLFTGRQWLLDRVHDWIATEGKRFLLLSGPPGIGKSAFVARLAEIEKFDLCHFCIARQQETIDPILFTTALYEHYAHIIP